jgi:hypothetical protein
MTVHVLDPPGGDGPLVVEPVADREREVFERGHGRTPIIAWSDRRAGHE